MRPGVLRPHLLLAAAFLAAQAALAVGFFRSAAPTYDEAAHLSRGYYDLATRDFRLNTRDHPPFAEMWAALPLVFMKPQLRAEDFAPDHEFTFGDRFLFHNRILPERMLGPCRAFCLASWLLLMGGALIGWAGRLAGPGGAVGAALCFALSPALISNLPLVTTDGASATFFFLTFWLLSMERRTPAVWSLAGVCMGLTMASKFNMVVILPLAALLLTLERGDGRPPGAPFPYAGALTAALAAMATIAAVYLFTQLPLYVKGFATTVGGMEEGRTSFLLGRYSMNGFWLYFPVALLVKTPLPILAAAGIGCARLLKGPRRELLWVLGPAAGYFVAAMAAKVQIGVRHLLPVMPFLALAAGRGLAALWEGPRKARALAVVLALWAAASVLRVHPYQLAYFNELAGGPENGWRWLVDSNLDWGQDLKTLAAELRRLGDPPIYLSYFGTADPAAYGIRYMPVVELPYASRPSDCADPEASGRTLFAVSATQLQTVYFVQKDVFDWLKVRKPLKVLGHSIFLYDLTADPEGRAELARMVEASRAAGLGAAACGRKKAP